MTDPSLTERYPSAHWVEGEEADSLRMSPEDWDRYHRDQLEEENAGLRATLAWAARKSAYMARDLSRAGQQDHRARKAQPVAQSLADGLAGYLR